MTRLTTASAVIGFAVRAEEESARLYENLAKRLPDHACVLEGFAEESRRNARDVQRAYYGVISDALEGCFSFDIDADRYRLDMLWNESAAVANPIEIALAIESRLVEFYQKVVLLGGRWFGLLHTRNGRNGGR